MDDPGRCELRLTRRYAASPGEVWAALTDADSIGRWLSPVVAVELDWHVAGEDRSVVRFELTADDAGGTVLALAHARIEAPLGMTYISRWSQALDRLAVP